MLKSQQNSNSPSLKASVNEGKCHAVMLGCGETYLSPFAVFLKATNLQIGLLASLPPLIGALCQPFGVYLMEKIPSRRRIVFWGIFLQALIWLPILLIPFFEGIGTRSAALLLSLAILYYMSAHFIIPVWNSLMGDLVPQQHRGSYFGYRNKLAGMSTFISMIAAGQVLHFCERTDNTLYGFALIFLLAGCAKLFSLKWLLRYDDPPLEIKTDTYFSFWQFITRTSKSNFAKFVFFIASVQFAANLSGPYFTVYMLTELNYSYSVFTIIVSLMYIAQFLTMQYWGKLGDEVGNRAIIGLCALGLSIVPFLWMISGHVLFIAMVQTFAGVMWAGFNLSTANFLLDAVTPGKRARCVAYQAMINASFVLLGALSGAKFLEYIPSDFGITRGIWAPESKFMNLLLLSGIFRILPLIILFKLFTEVRSESSLKHDKVMFGIMHIRPFSGLSFAPVGNLIKKTKKNKPSQ